MTDRRPTVLGLGISMPILAIIAVTLRCQARMVKKLRLEADDYTIFIALVLAIAFAVTVILDSRLGNLGGHQLFTAEGIPVANQSTIIFGKTSFAAQLLWYPTVGITKVSILLFYKRIFIGQRFRVLVWMLITFISCWAFTFFMAHLLACIPISAEWGVPLPGQCVSKPALYTSGSVTDVFGDIIILTLPIYNVVKLQMPVSRKIAVTATFLLGSLVVVTGIVRLVYVVDAFSGLKSPKADGTYMFAPAIYWTLIETSLGVVSACLPALRPLYRAYSIDSLIRSARNLTSIRLPGFKTSTDSLGGRYIETGSELTRPSLSAGDNNPYYTGKGQNGQQLPLNAYQTEVKAARLDDSRNSTEGIMVKNELSQHDNMARGNWEVLKSAGQNRTTVDYIA